uniref:Uncharacterized protein n=1 Tax=Rhizophora mucronata TaxID=61149 RepID=A0A2P2PHR3_RHIMU
MTSARNEQATKQLCTTLFSKLFYSFSNQFLLFLCCFILSYVFTV